MIIKQYIKDFETLGLGMFVHFGLYSVLGKGEWAKYCLNISDADYMSLADIINPKTDWAKELVTTAKKGGCKYITLTTRHHDGFSLYDTCGLNSYDAPHAKNCGRDLVREFVDACREQDIIPFFYHTLLDWYEPHFKTDFPTYLKYLRDSVEILCKNYGKIGGLWFDGKWSKPDDDWEEDALYALIRKYQPEAMIINNTGLKARGVLGHIELDSVTFERGKPQPLNMEGVPKYVASEMCEVLNAHWGYAKEDLNYKSPAELIEELVLCRKCGANMLINVGPMGDGSLRPIDEATLGIMGEWVSYYEEAIRKPRLADVSIVDKPEDFFLKEGNTYYYFCHGLPMIGDPNVAIKEKTELYVTFELPETIKSFTWLDDGSEISFTREGNQVTAFTTPFKYGRHLVIRVAKIIC